MNTNKPPRVRTCRGCSQKFTMEVAGQRYCVRCREARAEAMEALRVKTCSHCGAERADCVHGICPDCRTAKEQRKQAERDRINSAKLARYNDKGGCKCGKLATNPDDGLCDECHAKRMVELRQGIRQRRREAYDKRREEAAEKRATQSPQGDNDDDDFMTWFEGLSDDDQKYALNSLKDYAVLLGVSVPGTDSPPTVEESNPEQVDADDQSAVDATFASIMAEMEL